MNTKSNSPVDPALLYQEMLEKGEIKPVDYGVITGGSCSTPEAQAEFDKQQLGKPPLHD